MWMCVCVRVVPDGDSNEVLMTDIVCCNQLGIRCRSQQTTYPFCLICPTSYDCLVESNTKQRDTSYKPTCASRCLHGNLFWSKSSTHICWLWPALKQFSAHLLCRYSPLGPICQTVIANSASSNPTEIHFQVCALLIFVSEWGDGLRAYKWCCDCIMPCYLVWVKWWKTAVWVS